MLAVAALPPIADRARWPIDPEDLFLELRSPGRATLPKILPHASPTLTDLPSEAVTPALLGNFYMKAIPEIRKFAFGMVQEDHGIPFLERYAASALRGGAPLRYEIVAGRSLRFLKGTAADLISHIEESLAECGIDSKAIEAIRRALLHDFEKAQRELLPVYRKLRVLGYSHKDLTC